MRHLMPILIVVAALAATSSNALAKGVSSAQICGSAGCKQAEESSFRALMSADGTPTAAPSAAAPFVTVKITLRHGPQGERNRMAFDYLPSLGLTRPTHPASADEWVKLTPRGRAGLDEAVRGVQPRPASQLAGVAQPTGNGDDAAPAWWAPAGAALAALVLLALLGRYATSALKARPRASKSTN